MGGPLFLQVGTGSPWEPALGSLACATPTQVVSSILRNLSWRADINSKKVLREVGSMTALMQCVLRASKVSTQPGRGCGSVPGPGKPAECQPQCQEALAAGGEFCSLGGNNARLPTTWQVV